MGNKDKGKKEQKKPAKVQPKAAPARRRDDMSQVTSHIAGQAPKE
jgi:hypothetical protein